MRTSYKHCTDGAHGAPCDYNFPTFPYAAKTNDERTAADRARSAVELSNGRCTFFNSLLQKHPMCCTRLNRTLGIHRQRTLPR